ncbi:MAG: hypothetical protein OXG04_17730 [Acidobacteria bacterium]|nr:hypothetical protein [Acidobacteriota bacterium]
MIVVDASVVVEVLLRSHTGCGLEERLFEGDDPLHAPHMLDVEAAHALRRCAAPSGLDGQELTAGLDDSPWDSRPIHLRRVVP